jgi:plasmid maintenance system antidote protein VapI
MTTVLPSPDMTKEEFKQWYCRLKAIDPALTHAKLAERLDVDQPRIGKWIRGKVAISGYLHLALERLEQLMIAEQKPKHRRRQQKGDPA